jgi:hypothetical protein
MVIMERVKYWYEKSSKYKQFRDLNRIFRLILIFTYLVNNTSGWKIIVVSTRKIQHHILSTDFKKILFFRYIEVYFIVMFFNNLPVVLYYI